MPIFEHECEDCGKSDDYLMKFSDPAPACKSCGSEKTVRKVSTGTDFRLKGSGWYETSKSVDDSNQRRVIS